MSVSGKTIIQCFETYFPLWLAEQGDPVGLHIGTLNKSVNKVLVTLDVRPEVVAEAIDQKVDLIIAKHPPIFRPISHLISDYPQEKMYMDLIKNDIAVYAAHTNMDIAEGGLNDWFCDVLNIQNPKFLSKTHHLQCKKLAVYVPTEQANEVRHALYQIGIGQIGENYKNCNYTLSGMGRFTPINQANPTIGSLDKESMVSEEKIEMVFYENQEAKVLETLMKYHPYEEPAFDIYPIDNFGKDFGIGRIGFLPEAIPLTKFLESIKSVFQLDGLRYITNHPDKLVQKIAICGGSGQKLYSDALAQGADVYITGDVYYHTGHDMLTDDITVIDPGHNIEKLCIPKITTLLNQWAQLNNWELTVIPSKVDTNPFRFI